MPGESARGGDRHARAMDLSSVEKYALRRRLSVSVIKQPPRHMGSVQLSLKSWSAASLLSHILVAAQAPPPPPQLLRDRNGLTDMATFLLERGADDNSVWFAVENNKEVKDVWVQARARVTLDAQIARALQVQNTRPRDALATDSLPADLVSIIQGYVFHSPNLDLGA
jgi:hypothetical protein